MNVSVRIRRSIVQDETCFCAQTLAYHLFVSIVVFKPAFKAGFFFVCQISPHLKARIW